MAELADIVNKKIARLETVPETFIDIVDRQNSRLFKEALKLIDELEIKDGFIIASQSNLAIIDRLNTVLCRCIV